MPLAVDRMEALEERRKKAAARKSASLIPAPRAAPALTEESVKANLGIPVTGGIDPNYLASLGAAKSTPASTVTPTVTPTVPTSIQPRQPSSNVTDLLSRYERAVRQSPMSEEDIMDLPSYQAMQKLNEQTLGERLAALKRQFGAWGTLRGTPSIQAMANAVGQATTQLGGLVPEMLQTAWGREQQNLQNLSSLIGLTRDVEDTGFSQGLSEFSALAPYRYETVAGQREAELLPYKKELLQAQASQAKASATKATTPKETDYKQAFIQNAYRKLINGQPLTDDERRALNIDVSEKDIVTEAVKMAQNDPAFEDASEEERMAMIQRYVDMVKRLRGQGTSTVLPAARADVYLGATDGMTDEEIYRVFGQ
jgi:hypothetical protein